MDNNREAFLRMIMDIKKWMDKSLDIEHRVELLSIINRHVGAICERDRHEKEMTDQLLLRRAFKCPQAKS